jgi:two-component system, NarL family, sensor histidine kinase UhpB
MSQQLTAVCVEDNETDERRQRAAAQRTLEGQALLMQGVLDAIPDFFYAVDRDGRLVLANKAFAVTRSDSVQTDMIGRTLDEILPRGGLGASIAVDNAALFARGSGYEDRERFWITDRGQLHWYSVTKVLLRAAADGAITGLVSLVREITERKELERSVLEISEREQRRIGSDLHDGLGQELTGASLLLKSLQAEVARDSPQHLEHLRRAQEVLQNAIASTRSLARGLAPVDLEQARLPAALDALTRRIGEMYEVACNLECTGNIDEPLDLTRATHLYRIAQEALSNAARHGRARRIDVLLHIDREILLAVSDNGSGFDALAAGSAPGMGLRLMRYRASLLGGSVSVTSSAAGTRIECRCPEKSPAAGVSSNAD